MEPASIRFNNPGAMWGKGNKIATKWGSMGTTTLKDGLGQGNNIAFFPTKKIGACAQFDLWRAGYCNMTLRAAIQKWSGGNWSPPYADFLVSHTGISLSTTITSDLLKSDRGRLLMKYQAQWEAGKPYPLSDEEWMAAQAMVFSSPRASTPTEKKIATAVVVAAGTTTTAVQAAHGGWHWSAVAFVVVLGVVVTGVICAIIHQSHEANTSPPAPDASS